MENRSNGERLFDLEKEVNERLEDFMDAFIDDDEEEEENKNGKR